MMTDKTKIYVVESGANVIIKEKEGVAKNGDPKVVRVSTFREPVHAVRYLKEKYGISV